MIHKTRIVVLHTLKYGDSGNIIHAYTEHFGRQSFLIQGLRSKKSRTSPYLFQPLSLLNIEADVKENRELQRIKEVHTSVVLKNLHFEIHKSVIAAFISELLYRTLRDTETNEALFEYLFHAIQILDECDHGSENFHLLFLIQFTRFLGIYPQNHEELSRYYIDEQINIDRLLNLSLNDLEKLKFSGNRRYEMLNLLLEYYSNHLEGLGKLKSPEILREIFH